MVPGLHMADPASPLSEGEVVSSEAEEGEDGEVEREREDGGLCKRRRVEEEEEESKKMDDASSRDAVSPVVKKTAISEKERRQLKKQKKLHDRFLSSEAKRKKWKKKKGKAARASLPPPVQRPELLKSEKDIFHELVRLASGEPLAQPTRAPLIKTVQFQRIVTQILSPDLAMTAPSTEPLAGLRVVVAWLSLVSADLFDRSDEYFKRLKLLQPQVRFCIEHPGSSRFVKMGLEAFMQTEEEEEEGGHLDADKSAPEAEGAEFTRADCLLSVEELEINDFPVPSCPGNHDGYIHLEPECLVGVVCSELARYPMFAVDCEMVGTARGLELARVSVVDETLQCVYDALVKSDEPILDYKTQFSGITEETLSGVTKRLADAQTELRGVLPSRCILIGHSLENDLHALRLCHAHLIDTSLLFTPSFGAMNKPSLKMLTKKMLDLDIQVSLVPMQVSLVPVSLHCNLPGVRKTLCSKISRYNIMVHCFCPPPPQEGSMVGHCSTQDAGACMRLVLHKLREGRGCRLPWTDPTHTMMAKLSGRGISTGMVDKGSLLSLFGRLATFRLRAQTDDQTVDKALEVVPNCRFMFLQLHAMEHFIKSRSDVGEGPERMGQEGAESEEELRAVIKGLEEDVLRLVEEAPSQTLIFVVCGSNDIRQVKRCDRRDPAGDARLKSAVMAARTGCVVAVIAN